MDPAQSTSYPRLRNPDATAAATRTSSSTSSTRMRSPAPGAGVVWTEERRERSDRSEEGRRRLLGPRGPRERSERIRHGPGAGVAWTLRPSPTPLKISRFTIPLPEGQVFTNDGRHLVAISPDGGRIVYVANGRLHLRSIANLESVPIPGTEGRQGVLNPVFSPDGRHLAYTATPTPAQEEAWLTNHDLYEVEVETGVRHPITTNSAADAFPRYSPDGQWIAYRAQTRPGFEADRWQLMLHERATRKTRSLTPNFDSWVEAFVWAPDSRTLYFDAEEKAAKPLWSVTIAGNDVAKIVEKSVNGEVAVSPDGKTLVFARQSLSRPVEIGRANARGSDLQFITQANDALFAELNLSEPESVSYAGANGAPIQMWIVKPPGFDSTRKYPLVFWVHGGPQGAFMDAWSYRWNAQLWAAQRYVVALPNPRGSTGFGQKFVDEISHDWGGKVFEDLMAGVRYLEEQPYVDSARMAAAGASYGGYMMNWFQGHTDKFKTLVTHCGVFDFWTMYGTTEELWFDEWEHGIPWETPDFEKFSPHRHAARFKTPNLIVHNELDFRVPIGQGLSLFTTLQRKGVASKLLYFPDEGHWVLKPQNSELWHETIFDWLAEYLRP